LLDASDLERSEYVKKNNIWKQPDYVKMIEDGIPKEVCYFMSLCRGAIKAQPPLITTDKEITEQLQREYINFVSQIRDAVMSCKTMDDVKNLKNFLSDNEIIIINGRYYKSATPHLALMVTQKLVNIMMYYTNNLSYWNRKRNSTAFGMSTEEKKLARYDIIKFTKAHSFPISNDNKRMVVRGVGEVKLTGSESVPDITRDDFVEGTYFIRDSKLRTLLAINLETEEEAKDIILHPPKKDTQRNRPKEFIPIMLKNVTRTGLAWRRTQVKPEDVLKEFNVRGGEFGNWLSDKDRQASLNFCYDSFMDLAYALGIRSEDVSFDGKLAIAFGARGRIPCNGAF